MIERAREIDGEEGKRDEVTEEGKTKAKGKGKEEDNGGKRERERERELPTQYILLAPEY